MAFFGLDKGIVVSLYKGKIVRLALFSALGFWLLEASIHTYLLGLGTFTSNLLETTPNELWMRIIAIFLLIVLGIVAQYLTDTRKQLLMTIRDQERRLRILFNRGKDAIFVHQLTPQHRPDRFVEVNESACEMLGYERAEFLQLSPPALIAPHRKEETMSHLATLLKTRHHIFETEQVCKNGRHLPVEINAHMFELDGCPTVMAIARDITLRKQAERRLRLYQKVYADAKDAIAFIDREGFYLEQNQAHRELLGYSDEQLREMTPAVHFGEDIFLRILNDLSRLEVHQGEYRVRTAGRREIDIELLAFPVLNDEGEVICYVGVKRDITERKAIQDRIQKNERQLRQLINASNDAIYAIQFGRFVLVNHKFEEMFGYSAEEAMAQDFDFLRLVAPQSQELILERMQKRLSGEELPNRYIFQGRSKSGEILDLEASTSLIEWDGQPASLGILVNRTEVRKLEQQLLQIQKMEAVGTLAGGIAHDFNNILTAIRGYAQLALMRSGKEEPLVDDLKQILDASERAANLTRQILAFSRKQIIEPQILNINQLIINIERMIRRLIGDDIRLDTDLPGNIWRMKVDPGQMEQILINLIVNARDAVNAKTQRAAEKMIRIQTENVTLDEGYARAHPGGRPGEFVRIQVSDNGIGMSTEIRKKIFEPFFTTKEQGKGTGLGLSTVYGIVKQNEGFVYVYSEEGEGTTVTVYWPRSGEEISPRTHGGQRKKLVGGAETILVVEDDPGVRDFAAQALRSFGYQLLVAGDGEQALRIVKKNKRKIDLVVTDMVMPNSNGWELARQIKTIHPDVQVLFTSGYTDNYIVHKNVVKENVNFLQKPYSLEGLIRKIRDVLDQE